MTHRFSVPTPAGPIDFEIEPGTALMFVGANGGGKTRLAVEIEEKLGAQAHRISAQRVLNLNPDVAKVSERVALAGLRTGHASADAVVGNRAGSRWGNAPAIRLLDDFQFLVQALFANQTNMSLQGLKDARAGKAFDIPLTKLEKLTAIWSRLLPHRSLDISGDDIRVSASGEPQSYKASEMSDGERTVFYLIGQTLSAPSDGVLIIDEPELHIHRSIMSRLWDELEAARPDCSTIFISHDLEFVASRKGQKFVLKEYRPAAGWTIEAVPDESGFSEEIVTLILGSRKPVLFVEGQRRSLDQALYRACYPDWTIIPRGSCEEVIRAVVTMRANERLTRVKCAGIVDADSYDLGERAFFAKQGIAVLPVSEIENIFLLPPVAEALSATQGFDAAATAARLPPIFDELFRFAANSVNVEPIIARYCRRRIDRTLKNIDLSSAPNTTALAAEYAAKTAALDIAALAKIASDGIASAVANRDVSELLKWIDNKGANLALAAKIKEIPAARFEQWVVRTLGGSSTPTLSAAIKAVLPEVNAI